MTLTTNKLQIAENLSEANKTNRINRSIEINRADCCNK